MKRHILYSWICLHSAKPRLSYLYDITRVLLGPLPAPQLHPSVQRAEAGARLRAKQVILRVEVMGGPQGYFSWDKGVHVPVDRHAVNVASRVDVVQDLRGTRVEGKTECFIKLMIPNCLAPPVFLIHIHPVNNTNINLIKSPHHH